MIASPSQLTFGPGGDLVERPTDVNRLSVSAGELPFSTAMSLACSLAKLKPEVRSFLKKEAGVIFADAVM